MSHHIVEARDLHHTYPDGTAALRGVSFTIHHGESVGIIGANGAGKSTLLLHLNGFLSPTTGEVRVGEVPLGPSTVGDVRRHVGMVFQDPDDMLFMPTVEEDVAFGPANLGLPTAEIEHRVADALDRVGVSHLRAKPPYLLSGGEKKRASIAAVLSMNPDILVMDEPTNGLDPFARRRLMELLAAFPHTKIFTSHDLDMVAALCARVIVLSEGTVRADGPTMEIFRDEGLLAECRLEQPLSMQACPSCGKGDR